MEEGGGNIIAAMRMRMVEASAERVIMEMPMSGGVIQGTGVFAAGALMQLADVAATIDLPVRVRLHPRRSEAVPALDADQRQPLRNTNKGKAVSESRIVHGGRTLTVVESRVSDEEGRLMCIVTSTHVAVPR